MVRVDEKFQIPGASVQVEDLSNEIGTIVRYAYPKCWWCSLKRRLSLIRGAFWSWWYFGSDDDE